jgi:hypothetical protein
MADPDFKKNKVTQTINLKDVFGVDFKGNRALREAIGEAMLEKIRARTADGDGMNFSGRGGSATTLAKYSKDYVSSDTFSAHGKSAGEVNMNLTGTMMDTMDVVKQTGNEITLGWSDKEENNKAFNHSTGDTVTKRPFFGLSKAELKSLRSEFRTELKAAVKDKDNSGFENTVLSFIDGLGGKSDG